MSSPDQHTGGASWLSHHLPIWLLAALLVLAFWLHTFQLIDEDRAQTIASTENDLVNIGRLSQEHAERTFYTADQTLRMVIDQYQEHDGKIDLKAMTEKGFIDTRILVQVGIIDAQGILQLSNVPFSGHIDLSDRVHFKTHLTPGSDQLFISPPVLGRASGKWSVQLTRRISGKNGEFGGVVVASLDPTYFTNIYSAHVTTALAPGATITVTLSSAGYSTKSWFVCKLAGCAASGQPNQTSGNSSYGTAVTASATPSLAPTVLFGVVKARTSETYSGSSWTAIGAAQDSGAGRSWFVRKTATDTAAQDIGGTLSGNQVYYALWVSFN